MQMTESGWPRIKLNVRQDLNQAIWESGQSRCGRSTGQKLGGPSVETGPLQYIDAQLIIGTRARGADLSAFVQRPPPSAF